MLKGTVRYPHYNGFKIQGMKNKRVRKRDALRRLEREANRDDKRREKKKLYSVAPEYGKSHDSRRN